MTIERAWSTLEIKSASDDGEKRFMTGVASTPEVDRGGDVVDPKGVVMKLPFPFLWQHDSHQPIGHVTKAKVTDAGIEVGIQISKWDKPGKLKDRLDEAWDTLMAGLVRGLSIGFLPLESARIENGFGRHFTAWEMLELSAVTIPMNAGASIQTIKSMDQAPLREAIRKRGCVYLTVPPGLSGNTSVNPKGPT